MEAETEQKAVEAIGFAGPNGSGKSTITRLLRPRNVDYINADDIKKVLGCSDLEAAQQAERMKWNHIHEKAPFCFETVMSTERNLNLLKEAKKQGFFIRIYIVLTVDSSINVERVKGRVEAGGHDVPVDKIESRYERSLSLVKKVVQVSDVCNIYDNSFDYPVRFFNKKKDRYYYEEVPLWDLAAIESLIDIHDERLQRRDLNSRNPFAEEVLKK